MDKPVTCQAFSKLKTINLGQRKIALVVNKLNYREAEDADDKFWANATESERLYTLMDLRIMVFGLEELGSIEKVVYKKKIHEEA